MRKHRKITGLIAAPFTAFHTDGTLNLNAIPHQADYLKQQQVAGVFVSGTTGEGQALTLAERMELAEAWALHKAPDFTVIVHAGRASAREGAALARHAQETGADAVGAIYLHHEIPGSVDEVVAYCAEIAAGAPDLPFYYYHMPAQSRLPFKASSILQAAARTIPTLAGCKFTWEDLMDFQQCRQMEDGRLDIVFGRDEMLLASLAFGAEGWIGSTFNYAGLLHRKLIAAFHRHDLAEARHCQLEVNEVIRIMVEQGGLPAGKAISSIHGLDLGNVRAPLKALSETAKTQLAKRLAPYRLGPLREVAPVI